MAEKNKDAAESAPAESAVVETAAPVAREATTTAPGRRGLPVLATVGIAVGGVVLAGALFGGGVLLGTALPGGPGGGPHGGPGMSQGMHDESSEGDGDRGPGQIKPGQPGQGQQGGPGMPGEGMPPLPGDGTELDAPIEPTPTAP